MIKIEKLSHIKGPTPILEMARAYGLLPRLWLLVRAHPKAYGLRPRLWLLTLFLAFVVFAA